MMYNQTSLINFSHYDNFKFINGDVRDKELLKESLFKICDLATGFEDNNARLQIDNRAVNRKAKWAYDICKSIDNIHNDDIIKNIGTLSKLKIMKNG